MRSNSRRHAILTAALDVVENDGVAALTFDSLAEAAGVTKGGLQYHFNSREALLHALQEHGAQQWEDLLQVALAVPFEQSTARQRLIAYVRVTAHEATRAQLSLFVDGSRHPDRGAPWVRVLDRWAPHASDDQVPVELLLARLAADGLWAVESHSGTQLSAQRRQHIVDHIVALVPDAAAPPPNPPTVAANTVAADE